MATKKLEWDTSFSVGDKLMDSQHKWLFDIVDRVYLAEESSNREELLNAIEELFHYTREHFSSEEKLMKRIGLPDLQPHVQEHRVFEHEIRQFQQKVESGLGKEEQKYFIKFLTDWLLNHILIKDKQYKEFIDELDS